jgi:uncharacterized protein (DUF362 family)
MTLAEHRVGIAALDRPGYGDIAALRSVIRNAVAQGTEGTLSQLIPAGSVVLLKPNWVQDRNFSGATMDCMITHLSFIEAVLREVLGARPAKVVLADAPIQSAEFERMVPIAWQRKMAALCGSVPLEIVDLRNVVTQKRGRRFVRLKENHRQDKIVFFDLGADSLLEQISSPAGRFRCANYDPDRIIAVQRPGIHKYAISREPLEADVVINLPKLKAHRKAGVTGALKNLVGINGDKDYLPHHRVGSAANGGDCYAEPHPAKRAAELLLDVANRRIGKRGYAIAALAAGAAARVALPIGTGGIDGGWYGNDTVWRMTLDLNRILSYGGVDGAMHEQRQRSVFTITDAVICGQGEGPLAPVPLELGMVTFASNSAFADLVHTALMHFDWQRIPLVARAFGAMRWRLATSTPADLDAHANGIQLRWDDLVAMGRAFESPAGWRNQIELARARGVASA